MISQKGHSLPASEPLPPRLEIRPGIAKILRDSVSLVAISALFIALSLLLILHVEGKVAMVAGFLGLLLFGGMGIFALWDTVGRLVKRPVKLALTYAGLEVSVGAGRAFIPWDDVSQVGLVKISELNLVVVGLQLSSYDRYLGGLTPEMLGGWKQTFANKTDRLAGTPISWDSSETRQLWSSLSGVSDPARALKDWGRVGLHAETLFIHRQTFGFDLTFSPIDFDRPPPAMAELLEAHRQNFLSREKRR